MLLLALLAAACGGAALLIPSVRAKVFPEKEDFTAYSLKVLTRSPFQVSVEAKGTVDSSRNSTLLNNVEGNTTIISIVPPGTLVNSPLTSKVNGIVREVDGVSAGTARVVVEDESGNPVEHSYIAGPYAQRLVEIGQPVKAGDFLIGDVVCELDSSTLVDSERQQQIQVTQAEADLEKGRKNVEIQETQNESDQAAAKLAMDLAQLDLDKYIKGEYIQEKDRILGEIREAEEERTRAEEKLEFTRRVAKKGYKTQNDVEADRIALLKWDLSLAVKKRQYEVLELYTKDRTIKELTENARESKRELDRVILSGEAALYQFGAQLAAYDLTYGVQKNKLERLQKQIAACKLVAPQAGQVVYANQSSRSREPVVIEAGAAVRERQPIINLPDMNAMKVDAKIHESKISDVRVGLPVQIRIDAVPGVVYHGRLDAVSSVPLPGNWPNLDLKQYEAVVKITDVGDVINQLKPGMTANVEIIVERAAEDLLQIPVQAAIAIGDKRYAWVMTPQGPERRELTVGKSNDFGFVLLAGANEGEQVVMNPRKLFENEIKQMEDRYKQQMQVRENEEAAATVLQSRDVADNAATPTLPPADAPQLGGFDSSQFFRQRDANGDGKITLDEAQGPMKENFAQLDANSDGGIDQEEFRAGMGRFRPPRDGAIPGAGSPRGAE